MCGLLTVRHQSGSLHWALGRPSHKRVVVRISRNRGPMKGGNLFRTLPVGHGEFSNQHFTSSAPTMAKQRQLTRASMHHSCHERRKLNLNDFYSPNRLMRVSHTRGVDCITTRGSNPRSAVVMVTQDDSTMQSNS